MIQIQLIFKQEYLQYTCQRLVHGILTILLELNQSGIFVNCCRRVVLR